MLRTRAMCETVEHCPRVVATNDRWQFLSFVVCLPSSLYRFWKSFNQRLPVNYILFLNLKINDRIIFLFSESQRGVHLQQRITVVVLHDVWKVFGMSFQFLLFIVIDEVVRVAVIG